MGLKPMSSRRPRSSPASQRRSDHDLPIRCSEQGPVHRHEPSGALHGLLGIRHIAQDDAHMLATEDRIEEEVVRCLDSGSRSTSGSGSSPAELSTRPEKRIGNEDMSDRAEAALSGRWRTTTWRTSSTPATARSTGRRSTST